jgi:hypothetical protein
MPEAGVEQLQLQLVVQMRGEFAAFRHSALVKCFRPHIRELRAVFVPHSAYGAVCEPQRIVFSVRGQFHEALGKPLLQQ